MVTVAVAGKFDPMHNGHIEHIIAASKLGGYLWVITHTDDIVAMTSEKKVCWIPLHYRILTLEGLLLRLGIKGSVIVSIDHDGTVVKTLEAIKPQIFAKGGDRIPGNMPQNELDTCERLGIKIRYGVGKLLNSSSKILTS